MNPLFFGWGCEAEMRHCELPHHDMGWAQGNLTWTLTTAASHTLSSLCCRKMALKCPSASGSAEGGHSVL